MFGHDEAYRNAFGVGTSWAKTSENAIIARMLAGLFNFASDQMPEFPGTTGMAEGAGAGDAIVNETNRTHDEIQQMLKDIDEAEKEYLEATADRDYEAAVEASEKINDGWQYVNDMVDWFYFVMGWKGAGM